MMRNNNQLKPVDDRPAPFTVPIKLTDTSGNPSETYNWTQMAAVRREWQQENWLPFVDTSELTIPEIVSTEMRVRRELYP